MHHKHEDAGPNATSGNASSIWHAGIMGRWLNRSPLAAAALAFSILATGLAAPTTPAYAVSLEGNWSGSGHVKPKSGQRERVRCRVSYARQSAKVYFVSATCATASTTIRQTGQLLMVNPNRYVGDFYNSAYDISGRVRVIVRGASQTVTFSSASGSGSMTLRKR